MFRDRRPSIKYDGRTSDGKSGELTVNRQTFELSKGLLILVATLLRPNQSSGVALSSSRKGAVDGESEENSDNFSLPKHQSEMQQPAGRLRELSRKHRFECYREFTNVVRC